MTDYVIASRVDWHYGEFERLKSEEKGNWYWVATPNELTECLKSTKPRYIFFLHWSWKVPPELHQTIECVCFHMTDVPYGRGGSPLQNLILHGHRSTMLSALRMVDEMDAGPVYLKKSLSLDGRAQAIYERAGRLSFDMLRLIKGQEIEPEPQQGDIKLFERRKPEQSDLSTAKINSLEQFYDFVRMLDAEGYPSSFLTLGDFRLEFTDAELENDKVRTKVTITKRSENGN